MFICGWRSFTHQHKEENKTNKNPYADQGLDRFSTLLADLDHKKQRIYAQMGSDEISFVRFVYSGADSKQVKPIVVKVKNKNKKRTFLRNSEADKICFDEIPGNREIVVLENLGKRYGVRDRRFGYCLAAIMVVILVFLVIYGRLLAIIWGTIGWYLIPSVVGKGKRKVSEKKSVREEASCSESGMSGLRDGAITVQQYVEPSRAGPCRDRSEILRLHQS